MTQGVQKNKDINADHKQQNIWQQVTTNGLQIKDGELSGPSNEAAYLYVAQVILLSPEP